MYNAVSTTRFENTHSDRNSKRAAAYKLESEMTIFDVQPENEGLTQTSTNSDVLSSAEILIPSGKMFEKTTLEFDTTQNAALVDVCKSEADRTQREEDNCKCGFLRLSPELRNRIYQDTIPTSTRISVVARVSRTEINLLQVCRAIRNETVPIFYGNTTFNFDLRTRSNFSKAMSWVNGLSPAAVASLRKIYVHSDMNCCCKGVERGKNDKSTSLTVWVDVDRNRWSNYDYDGCRSCHGSGQEGARDIARRIAHRVLKQKVRKQDLTELFEIMRPIRAFDFSFEVAKDGEGHATYEMRPKVFGATGTSKQGSIVSPHIALRAIKQPKSRHRSVIQLNNVASLSLEDDRPPTKTISTERNSLFGS